MRKQSSGLFSGAARRASPLIPDKSEGLAPIYGSVSSLGRRRGNRVFCEHDPCVSDASAGKLERAAKLDDLGPLLLAIGVFVFLPVLLWAEAYRCAPRWFRILANVLIALWLLPIAAMTLTEIVCKGGWYNGYGNCMGPLESEFYNRLLLLWPLMPIAFVIYWSAFLVRLFEGLSKHRQARKDREQK